MKYCENVEARDCNLGWAASENPTVCFLSLQYSGRTFVKAWFTDDLFFISDGPTWWRTMLHGMCCL